MQLKMEKKNQRPEIHITNNYNAPIGQKIDHVDTIHFRMDGDGTFHFGTVSKLKQDRPLPPELTSNEAKALFEKAREAGFLDEDFQPLVSRPQAALLAYEIARRLKIQNKWKVFEAFWHRNNMRNDYNEAMNQQQGGKMIEKLKAL